MRTKRSPLTIDERRLRRRFRHAIGYWQDRLDELERRGDGKPAEIRSALGEARTRWLERCKP